MCAGCINDGRYSDAAALDFLGGSITPSHSHLCQHFCALQAHWIFWALHVTAASKTLCHSQSPNLLSRKCFLSRLMLEHSHLRRASMSKQCKAAFDTTKLSAVRPCRLKQHTCLAATHSWFVTPQPCTALH